MAYKKGDPVFRDKKQTVREPALWHLLDVGGYLVDLYVTDLESGKRVRLRKTIRTLQQAKKWRDKQKGDALNGEIHGRGPRKVLFKDFTVEYYEEWRETCKASTAYSEKNRIEGVLKPYFGNKQLHNICRKDVETFLRKRRDGSLNDVVAQGRRNNREGGVSKATTNRDLCRLKNMFRKAVEWGYLKENPVLGIPQSKEAFGVAEYLEGDEITRFLKCTEEAYRPIFLTAIYTGMRFGELMGLEWGDVDFTLKRITVRNTKNNENRYIQINPQVQETLRPLKGKGRVFTNPETGKPYNDIRKAMHRALQKAGVRRHIRFHDLRHTTASHLAMSGATEREIGEVLGHKDPKMSRRYSHLSPVHIQRVIERLDFSDQEDEIKAAAIE